MNGLVTRQQCSPPHEHCGYFSVPISCCGGDFGLLSESDVADHEAVYGSSLKGMVHVMPEDGTLPPLAFDPRSNDKLTLTPSGYQHEGCIERLHRERLA